MNTPSTDELQTESDYRVDLWKSLKHLYKCPHFKKVITEGYVRNQTTLLAESLGYPHTKENGHFNEAISDIVAISKFSYFLHMVESMGNIPPEAYDDYEGE